MPRFQAPVTDRPTVGLLHADIDVQSNYNPTKLTDLAGRGVGAWVLGHVHAGRKWEEPLAFYPGSPQALDAGESGAHGVHWLTVEGVNLTVSVAVPLSTVRFEAVDLEIGPEESVDDAVLGYLSGEAAPEERLSLRIRLRRVSGARPTVPDGVVAIDRHLYEIVDAVDVIEQNLDLEREAGQSDARGQAARLLLGLDGRGDPAWVRQAEELVGQVRVEMDTNRRRLKTSGREEFRQLETIPEDESLAAVRASLESVLAATTGAAL
jgi:DNA repair exonuclease SbcCD nuclease subunit